VLEAQRELIGDAVTDAALTPMRARLARSVLPPRPAILLF